MNWDALGAVAELLGAVGVIASLVFVGLQVRQNTRSVRAATYDQLVRSNGEWLTSLINDPALAAGFEQVVASWSDVDERERPRIMYLVTQLFRHWENAFFQQRQGTLEPGLWATWEGIILSYFHQPGDPGVVAGTAPRVLRRLPGLPGSIHATGAHHPHHAPAGRGARRQPNPTRP